MEILNFYTLFKNKAIIFANSNIYLLIYSYIFDKKNDIINNMGYQQVIH